jgi:outer membrane lipase/esterase
VHHGSADGSNLVAALNAGWDLGEGAVRHGPVVSLVSQRIEIDGFAESEPGASTSLATSESWRRSGYASVGWQASYAIHAHLQPYARLTLDRELEDPAEEAFAQAQSLPTTLPYAVPGLQRDDSYRTLTFGARTRLFGLDANLGTSLNIGQKGGKHATVFATIGGGF